nr:MAG TPA: hypothetical protein [Caudoviricetes sp.]
MWMRGLSGQGDDVCVRVVLMPHVYAFIRARCKPDGARFRPSPGDLRLLTDRVS